MILTATAARVTADGAPLRFPADYAFRRPTEHPIDRALRLWRESRGKRHRMRTRRERRQRGVPWV
jgi:hypothetical protein